MIETQRLQLRPLGPDDEAIYCRIYTDPQLMTHVAPPLSAEAAARSFQSALRTAQSPWRWLFWIMRDRALDADIGLTGLTRDTEGAEIGAMVLLSYQDVGYAGEAMSAVIDHAFRELALPSLHGQHPSANRRSLRLMDRLGFLHIPPSESCPDERWQLSRERWLKRHDAPGYVIS